MAKTTFFKKNIKTLAQFPPDGIYIYTCSYTGYIVAYTYTYKPCTMPHVIVCFSLSAWSACFLLYDHYGPILACGDICLLFSLRV